MNRTDRKLLWTTLVLVLVAIVTPVVTGTLVSGGNAYGGGMGMAPRGMMAPDRMWEGMPGPQMMPSSDGPMPGTTMPEGMMGGMGSGWGTGAGAGLYTLSALAFWGAILAAAAFFARQVAGQPSA